jgi:hypothetical protein
MKRIAKYRPSGPMLLAVAAVVIATTGSATAASLITSSQIANNSITGTDIRNNTVTGRDVRNRSLLSNDFKRGQIPVGPRGSTGPAGPPGAAGRDGFGLLTYPSDEDLLASGTSTSLTVDCPDGTFVTGGSAAAIEEVTGDHVGNVVVRNQSVAPSDGYSAQFENELRSGNSVQVSIGAVCANASQVVSKPGQGSSGGN